MTFRNLIITTLVISVGVVSLFVTLLPTHAPTAILVLVLIGTAAAWDVWMVKDGKVGTSISAVMIWAGLKAPATIFAMGFIMGHFYGYFTPVDIRPCKTIELVQPQMIDGGPVKALPSR